MWLLRGTDLDQLGKSVGHTGTPKGSRTGTSERLSERISHWLSYGRSYGARRSDLGAALRNGHPETAGDAGSPLGCDGALHRHALQAFDRDERVIDAALAQAGMRDLLDEAALGGRRRAARGVQVAGRPDGLFRPTDLGGVATEAGGPTAEGSRSSRNLRLRRCRRAVLPDRRRTCQMEDPASDVRGRFERMFPGLPDLPADVRESERRAWLGIDELLATERACGCHGVGTPIVAAAPFLARWTGMSVETARDARRRLTARGLLTVVGKTPVPGTGRKANLYVVSGEPGATSAMTNGWLGVGRR